MTHIAKIVRTGLDQAVRLPREYRFDGDEVRISYEDGRVILEGAAASPEEAAAVEAEQALERLRALIDEGMEGEDEPLDMQEIKRSARAGFYSND